MTALQRKMIIKETPTSRKLPEKPSFELPGSAHHQTPYQSEISSLIDLISQTEWATISLLYLHLSPNLKDKYRF